MKIKSLCFAVVLFIPSSVAAQTADEIVNKVLAARGGVSRIKAVHSQRISGTISILAQAPMDRFLWSWAARQNAH